MIRRNRDYPPVVPAPEPESIATVPGATVIPAPEPESIGFRPWYKLALRFLTSSPHPLTSSPRKRGSPNASSRQLDHQSSMRHPLGTGGNSRRGILGFTLLEVMIALLVIALGIGAVINTTSESGWKSAQLKQRTIASWVAQNEIARYRSKRTWDKKSNLSGETEMANAVWIWRMKITPTDDPAVRRIDVDVYLEGEEGIKASLAAAIALI